MGGCRARTGGQSEVSVGGGASAAIACGRSRPARPTGGSFGTAEGDASAEGEPGEAGDPGEPGPCGEPGSPHVSCCRASSDLASGERAGIEPLTRAVAEGGSGRRPPLAAEPNPAHPAVLGGASLAPRGARGRPCGEGRQGGNVAEGSPEHQQNQAPTSCPTHYFGHSSHDSHEQLSSGISIAIHQICF